MSRLCVCVVVVVSFIFIMCSCVRVSVIVVSVFSIVIFCVITIPWLENITNFLVYRGKMLHVRLLLLLFAVFICVYVYECLLMMSQLM